MYHVSGRQHAAEAGGRRRAGTGGQPACPGRCAYVQLYALPWPITCRPHILASILSCLAEAHVMRCICVLLRSSSTPARQLEVSGHYQHRSLASALHQQRAQRKWPAQREVATTATRTRAHRW
jgi:hypothetical protein